MLIFIFQGAKGDIHTLNEVSASAELRNRNTWQRRDLVYLGAVDDKELTEYSQGLRDLAINKVLDEYPKFDLLKKQIELAEMDGDQMMIARKKLELDIARSELETKIRNTKEYQSNEIDGLQGKVNKMINDLYDEKLRSLTPDPKIIPRNFNNLTSGFNGEASQPAPDGLSGILSF